MLENISHWILNPSIIHQNEYYYMQYHLHYSPELILLSRHNSLSIELSNYGIRDQVLLASSSLPPVAVQSASWFVSWRINKVSYTVACTWVKIFSRGWNQIRHHLNASQLHLPLTGNWNFHATFIYYLMSN